MSTLSNATIANTHVFPVPDFAWTTRSKIETETVCALLDLGREPQSKRNRVVHSRAISLVVLIFLITHPVNEYMYIQLLNKRKFFYMQFTV